MEIWDLYDKDRTLTGQYMVRGEEVPEDKYHLVVHVWIKNKKGEYIISQRSASRPNNPLLWETSGGSVLKGETSVEGAIREVKEEIGIDLDKNKGKVVFSHTRHTINGQRFNDIMDVWLFEYDGPLTLEKATTDEVADVKWATKEEIQKLMDAKKFVPSLFYFFERDDL